MTMENIPSPCHHVYKHKKQVYRKIKYKDVNVLIQQSKSNKARA